MLRLQKQTTWKGTSVIRKSTNLQRKLLSICIMTARVLRREADAEAYTAQRPERLHT